MRSIVTLKNLSLSTGGCRIREEEEGQADREELVVQGDRGVAEAALRAVRPCRGQSMT